MKTKRKLAKVKKNAEVAAKLADLRAALKVTRGDLVTSGRRIGELETEIAALEAERDELGAAVDKSNDMARGKTREVWALRQDLHATENKLAEMEEQLQEFQDELPAPRTRRPSARRTRTRTTRRRRASARTQAGSTRMKYARLR